MSADVNIIEKTGEFYVYYIGQFEKSAGEH